MCQKIAYGSGTRLVAQRPTEQIPAHTKISPESAAQTRRVTLAEMGVVDAMKISIVIDGSAWNYLFKNSIDLLIALPPEKFDVFIPREVEIELRATPEISKGGHSNAAFKQYVSDTIESRQVSTSAIFGFAEASDPSGVHRYAGFGQGTFASDAERAYYDHAVTRQHVLGRPTRPSGLTQREADAALAASSFHSVVLTCDKKKGPIKDAPKQGGKVIYLDDFDAQSLPLATYIINGVLDDGHHHIFAGDT